MLFSISRILRRPLQKSIQLVVENFNRRASLNRSMAGEVVDGDGVPLRVIVDELDRYAPSSYAESWDNVGLLIEPTEPLLVRRILLTNDLTQSVILEALKIKANLVVSYHPLVFEPLKRITSTQWKERIVATALENRIAVYSPHTAWDAVQGGVADWLAAAFRGHYDESSVEPLVKEASPAPQIGNAIRIGMGRIFHTKNLTLMNCVDLVKKHVDLPHIRLSLAYGKDPDSPVNCIAVVPGSGGSLLKSSTISPLPDLFLTGEMLHHDVLDAAHKGVSIILTNHSDSERGFLRHVMVSKLHSALNSQVEIVVSKTDRDPLLVV